MRSLPERFKVDIFVKPGSHQSENAGKSSKLSRHSHDSLLFREFRLSPVSNDDKISLVNKQLNDKERVAAALENPVLLDTVEQCLSNVGSRVSP